MLRARVDLRSDFHVKSPGGLFVKGRRETHRQNELPNMVSTLLRLLGSFIVDTIIGTPLPAGVFQRYLSGSASGGPSRGALQTTEQA